MKFRVTVKIIVSFILKWFMFIQLIFAIVMILITAIANSASAKSNLIITLLSLIVADFFVYAFNYLEDIKKGILEISKLLTKKGLNVEFVNRHQFPLREKVMSAHNDIFISGTTLTNMVRKTELFRTVSPNISIHFLVLDLNNEDILEGFRRFRYKDSTIHSKERYYNQGKMFKNLYNALRGYQNIHFGVSDRITPITFIAVDIDRITPSSMIQVQHYLYEKEADEATVSYILTPSNPLFEMYRDEIHILWENAIKDPSKLYFDDSSDFNH